VTVPGDLVVPPDSSCTLDGTRVRGDVRVARGADLLISDATIRGDVRANRDAYFEAVDSTIRGQVVLRNAFGGYVEGSNLRDRFVTRVSEDSADGFVYAFESQIRRDVISRNGEVFLEGSDVGGAVSSTGSLYTDVYSTFIDGAITVRGNQLGGVFCASVVQGAGDYRNNSALVQLGANGLSACEGDSYWGGNVEVRGNNADVYVDDNIVNGDVVLRGNDPVAKVGPDNRIRGELIGEYEEWSGEQAQLRTFSARGADRREQALEQKIDRRHAAAVKGADRAGQARIG